MAAYELGYYNRAISLFVDCLEKDREHADAMYYLGQSLKALGNNNDGDKFINQSNAYQDLEYSSKDQIANVVIF